jgi:hypothetical protein
MAMLLVIVLGPAVLALDNRVADTPPRGWCSWQRYRCHIACDDATSAECFNERLIKDTADAMVAGGYRDAGYEYVALDDCWQAAQRIDGHLTAHPTRFPSGIKALAAYVHARGLKLGLYTALGNNSCAADKFVGPPPWGAAAQTGLGCDERALPKCSRAQIDIDDFVSWDIDHLKVDGCQQFDELHMNSSYAVVGGMLRDAAAKAGRAPVVYHPSNLGFKFPRQFRELAAIGNQWRFFDDAQDDWASIAALINVMGAGMPACTPGPLPPNCTGDAMLSGAANTACASYCVERDQYVGVAGRGGWHDPDELLVGNTNCSCATLRYPSCRFTRNSTGMSCQSVSHDEEQLQMALWSMSSAPLFMSTDVPAIPEASRAILLNRGALAINADPLGRMPFRYRVGASGVRGAELWRKELVGGDVAVAVVNMGASDIGAAAVVLNLLEAGFSSETHVAVYDVFAEEELGWHTAEYTVAKPIPSHGVLLLRLSYSPLLTGARHAEL